MNKDEFISNYREAFGESVKLPLVFWYSDTPVADPVKINGCMFKFLPKAQAGENVSMDEQTLGCGGGKFYSGFIPMPERIPTFVSEKEKYKKTPEDVVDFLDKLQVPAASKKYLNFSRIDKIDNFDDKEGLLFIVEPDALSGLATWAYFDNNDENAVLSSFGSGCSSTITLTVLENQKNGRRTFLGGFDPSVRPYFGKNELTFTIPMSRFKEMYTTLRESCLYDTHAWKKVKERINS
ncbi:MAG: DUF169 domain-containing protein [Tannerella sp.]|jgi:uncharacterized protein (DUF169 family)|nr:DUF169 domain-containing protein [Tannerella sp.]